MSSAPQHSNRMMASPAGQPEPPVTGFGEEHELWRGRMSWSNYVHVGVLWLLGAAALLWLWWRFSGDAAWLGKLVAALIPGSAVVLFVKFAVKVYGTRYRLTTQRIFFEKGILSRTTDQTELLRIDDVSTRQSILDRMFQIGDVQMASSDPVQPRLIIEGIPHPNTVAEHIRNNALQMRNKRTMYVEHV